MLRIPDGRDPHARRPGRAGRALLDGGRPRASHWAVARLDPDQPHASRPRGARQRQLRPAPDGAQRGRGLPAGRVPDGRLRLGLPLEPPLRLRPRLRDLRRPAPAREGPAPDAVRRADGGRDDGRCPPLARRAASGRPGPVLPLGPLLRPPRPLRGAGGVHGAGGHAVRRRDLVRGRPARPPAAPRRRGRRASTACSSSSPRTTAKASASTARTLTASSSTTRRSGCLSSWPGPACPRAAWRRRSRVASTWRRPSSTTRISRRRGWRAGRCAGRPPARAWPTRRPTQSRSTRSSSTGGPRSSPGGRRASR